MAKSRLGILVLVASFLWACGTDETKDVEVTETDFVMIDTFDADSLRVEVGDSVSLSWEVRNAREVRLFANQAPVEIGDDLQGSARVPVQERTRFRLEAVGNDGRTIHRALVVEAKTTDRTPVVLSFVASPSEVDIGERSTLSWTTTNATEVELFDGAGAPVPLGGAEAAEGSVEVELLDGDVTYRLVATGEEGSTERTLFIKVRGTPRAEFGASSTRIAAGETATLNWSVEDASRLVLREVGGEILVDTDTTFQGSFEVTPKRSTTYELRATGSWRDSIETLTVDVGPELLLFEVVEKGALGEGRPATLRWKTAGAVLVEISNLEGAVDTFTGYQVEEGSAPLLMGSQGRFQIVVVGGDGEEISDEVEAEVLGLPSVGSLTVNPQLTSQQVQPVKVTVAWSGIENAETVTLVGDTFGRVGHFKPPFADGEMELWLRETANLTLTASNSAGEASLEATATLVPLPSIQDFVLFPRHAAAGESTQVSWSVDGAQSVVLEFNGQEVHRDEPAAGSGTYTRTITEPGSFRIVATNSAGGVVEATRAVTVGAPEIRSFSVPSSAIPLGSPVNLSWVNRGGILLTVLKDGVAVCQANTPAEIEDGGCTLPGSQAERSTYTLRLENGLGQIVERELNIVVTDGPIIETFVSSHAETCPGEAVEVSWSVTNDMAGNPPTLSLVDSLGNVYDLSNRDPNEGSFSLPYLEVGTFQYTLKASTPGTFDDEASLLVGMLEETMFTNVSVEPAVASPGDPVTISWDTICADGVSVLFGDLTPRPSSVPFQDIKSTGTQHAATDTCDSGFSARDEGCEIINFPSGFSFPFDGEVHSAIKVYANGFASFDLARVGSSWSTTDLPAVSRDYIHLAIHYADLFLDTSDENYYYQTVMEGGRQGLLIQWGTLSTGTDMQMVLFSDGTFSYRYGTTSLTGSSGRIGWQNLSGTEAEMLTQRSAIPGGLQNKSWDFGHGSGGPAGSYTFTPTSTRDIVLKATGLTEADTTVQVVVQ